MLHKKLRITILLAVSLMMFPVSALAAAVVDWNNQASYTGDNNGIASWSIVEGDGGYYIHLVKKYWLGGTLNLDNGKSIIYNGGVRNNSWGEISGSTVTDLQDDQVEFFIPADYFANATTISFGAASLTIADIPSISGGAESGGGESGGEETDTPPVVPDTPALEPTGSGRIVVDGSAKDWESAGVKSIAVQDTSSLGGIDVREWRAVRDTDGNLYLCFTGNANKYQSLNWVGINLDGKTVQFNTLMNYTDGVEYVYQCDANSSEAASFVMEFMIPADYFENENYTVSFGGAGYTADMIPVLNGEDAGGDKPAVYDGIQIDGHFEDWDAVTKTEVSAVNGGGVNCLESTAMVFDGDYVYIYLREDAANGASSAGSHSNGRYAIITDLGYTLSFQLTKDGDINGANGKATAKHVGSQWEVAIPTSELPFYNDTISFGFYMGEPFVKDVSNMNGSGGNVGEFNGIVIDGMYGDWDAYPHTLIEYATPGTQVTVADAEGALYYANGKVFGHVSTAMPEHLASKGGDFLAAISIAFNGDREYKANPKEGNFYPRIVDIDENGNVTTLNEGTKLENGKHTFYIFDTRTDPGTDPEWIRENAMGIMKVDINGVKDEMEFELYMDKVAQYIGADASDLKTVEGQFGRLGQQWLSTSGASSGPLLGVIVCLAAAGSGIWYSRNRRVEEK